MVLLQVRLWALKTFKSMGSVDCDEYDELENVIDWLLDVINFNLFVNHNDSDSLSNWDDTQNVILPQYLFTNKPRDFWLGICTILTAMTKGCIQTRLLTSHLNHKELVESVLVLLDKDPDKEYSISNFQNQPEFYKCKNTVFWPVLQCFVLLLDKLGSRFWMITTTTPNSILKLIKFNPYYQLQLEICYKQAAQLDLAINNEYNFSFSQLVYDDSLDKIPKPMEPLQERYHGFSLSWVVPFIKSLIDFGDYESSTIVELLDFVCHIHSMSLHGDTNVSSTDLFQTVLPIETVAERVESLFLSQESLKCISLSVDVLFSQKVYSVLLQCKQAIFCMIAVLCSHVLSKGKNLQPSLNQSKQHMSQTARTYTSLVMYCSTEKTAGKLWHLVEQISSLSHLSVISSQVGGSHSCTDLLQQPDDLCEILLKMIADKQNDQDIVGPFSYPSSADHSALKKNTGDVIVVKQEPIEETKCKSAEMKQESLLDHNPYHLESPLFNKDLVNAKQQCTVSTKKTTVGSIFSELNHQQVSLKLNKLPIMVLKSDKGILHYQYNSSNNNIVESSESTCETLMMPSMSQLESDTDPCSLSSDDDDDDDDDDLPRYLSFSKKERKFTDISTSSTVTIENEFNEQLVVQKTTVIGARSVTNVHVLSPSVPLKKSDGNIKSQIENVIPSVKNAADLASPHSECSSPKQSSEEYLLTKAKDSSTKLQIGNDVKLDRDTFLSVDQEWCDNTEQNSICVSVNRSSSIIDQVLLDYDPHLSKNSITEESAINGQCASKLDNTLTEQQESINPELGSVNNEFCLNSGDEVFQHTDRLSSIDKHQSKNLDEDFIEDVNDDPIGYEKQQSTKGYQSFADSNFVVIPNKHSDLKFKPKVTEARTDVENNDETVNQVDSMNNCGAELSHLPHFQQPNTMSKQQMLSDKIQPAVAGRAPFSRSRMPSLHIPSALNSITKVQTSKAKGNVTGKDLYKKTLEQVGQTSAVTTEISKVAVKVDLSKVHSKEEFLMDVLSWNPATFYQGKESDKSVGNGGPNSLPSIAKVPLTFDSSDQYVEVFKPLLLLETWDTVSL